MRKTLFVVVGVAFALLVGVVVPVNAQGILRGGYTPSSPEGWYYYITGNQVMMLQADNLHMVDQFMGMGRRAQLRRVTDDLVPYGGYMGLRNGSDFYPMYQCGKGQRVANYAVNIATNAVLGGMIRGKKGAAIGGGLGALEAFVEDGPCRAVNNDRVQIVGMGSGDDDIVVVDPPPTGGPQAVSGRENGWNSRLRNQANAGGLLFGSRRGCMEQGMATLKNEGKNPLRVYQNGTPYVDLLPRQSECGDPYASYEAEVVTMVIDGFSGSADSVRTRPEGRDGLILVWR